MWQFRSHGFSSGSLGPSPQQNHLGVGVTNWLITFEEGWNATRYLVLIYVFVYP